MFTRSDKVEELEAVSSQLWQTNVIGNVHLFHLFLPLVLKGKVKKVITISTGLADIDLTNDVEIDIGSLYAASKAAMNVIVAKFNVQYKNDGVLFMAISPGVVEVGHYSSSTYPRQSRRSKYLGNRLMYTNSHSRRDAGIDGICRQACGLRASFQRPNFDRRIRASGQVGLGEG